ncbi:hypothetical protein HDE_13401 [Halotydeus destructor]|nr:hypothetical protein HDE_13401 [Halotydeus destructor]
MDSSSENSSTYSNTLAEATRHIQGLVEAEKLRIQEQVDYQRQLAGMVELKQKHLSSLYQKNFEMQEKLHMYRSRIANISAQLNRINEEVARDSKQRQVLTEEKNLLEKRLHDKDSWKTRLDLLKDEKENTMQTWKIDYESKFKKIEQDVHLAKAQAMHNTHHHMP